MVTKKFTIYTKHQKLALKILDMIQVFLGLFLTSFIVLAMLVAQKKLSTWNIILGVAGIISLVEIVIRKAYNKQSFFYKLLLKLFKSNIALFPPTPMQLEVCSWINAKIQNGKGILIYGKANIGKTSSIFIYLSQHTKDKDLLQQLKWTESIIYVDCKNNKGDILDFFGHEGKHFYKRIYGNSLIIVDNLEAMGKTFFESLLQIMNSSVGTFILIADTGKMDDNMCDMLEMKCMGNNCTLSLNSSDLESFKRCYKTLTDNEKKVFLLIYYISLSTTLVPIKDVFHILTPNYSYFYFKMLLNVLSKKGLIKKFPFDHSYILLANRANVVKNQIIFWDTSSNSEAMTKVIQNSVKYPESAWLSLVHLPYEQIIQQDSQNKQKLFSNALKCGNYMTLFNALQDELTYCPNKEDLFLYEIGTLYFYNSYQEKAFEKYNKFINREVSDATKYATMLRIIEATHGDVNSSTIKNIKSYIETISAVNYEYSLYAEYWELHIESERGNFLLEKYTELLSNLIILNETSIIKDVYLELVKRCYTDIIRSYYILKISPENHLISGFLDFMSKNFDNTLYKYYKALYVEANRLHYVTLLDNILNGENCQSTYDKAISYYNIALRNGFENFKSVSACELKSIDLKLFSPDNINEFQDYKIKINKFLSNAEINKVSVHVAYCKTLLAKMYMIKNLYDEDYLAASNKKEKDLEIQAYVDEAKKIYKDYHNEYGVVRIEFLEMLYHFVALSKKTDLENAVKKMAGILKIHQEYQREMNIIDFLKRKLENNEGMYMCVIAIIKAYPIIMQ